VMSAKPKKGELGLGALGIEGGKKQLRGGTRDLLQTLSLWSGQMDARRRCTGEPIPSGSGAEDEAKKGRGRRDNDRERKAVPRVDLSPKKLERDIERITKSPRWGVE